MKIILTDNDIKHALGKDSQRKILRKDDATYLGEEKKSKETAVFEALPKALTLKIKEMIPSDFKLHEIEFKISIGGKPFGVGLNGDVTVKFGPKK